VVQLAECFRCGPAITEAANRLIAHNRGEVCDPLISRAGHRAHVEVGTGDVSMVAAAAQILHDERLFAWKDIAILARTHQWLNEVERELDALGLPYRRTGQLEETRQTDAFRLLHSLLSLIVFPLDSLAFMRAYTVLGLKAHDYQQVRSEATCRGCGHFEAWANLVQPEDLSDLAREVLRHAQATVDQDRAPRVRDILAEDSAMGRLCGGYLRKYWVESPLGGMRLDAALKYHASRDIQSELEEDVPDDVMTLATVHGVKGLEWPAVILAGACEGGLPSSRARTEEDVADERRVAYVAFTRAAEECVIVVPLDAQRGDKRIPVEPSRFIAEAGLSFAEVET
jgi:superfamily I DNA/RNA helicase